MRILKTLLFLLVIPVTAWSQALTFCSAGANCTVTGEWAFNNGLTVSGAYIDARKYGVVCDGVTDNNPTSAGPLQTAANAAMAANIWLFVPSNTAGDCKYSTTLTGYAFNSGYGQNIGLRLDGVGGICNNYGSKPSTAPASCLEYTGTGTAVEFGDGTHITYSPQAVGVGVKCGNASGCTNGWDFNSSISLGTSEGYVLDDISAYPGTGWTGWGNAYQFTNGFNLGHSSGLTIMRPLINSTTNAFACNGCSIVNILSPAVYQATHAYDFTGGTTSFTVTGSSQYEMVDVAYNFHDTAQAIYSNISASGKFLIDPQFGFSCAHCQIARAVSSGTGGEIFLGADFHDVYTTISLQVLTATRSSGGTGSGTGTCAVTFTNGGGSGATGTLPVTSGTLGSTITVTAGGANFTSAPTSATLSNGTATCSGTIVTTGTLTGAIPTAQFDFSGLAGSGSNYGVIDIADFSSGDTSDLCNTGSVAGMVCNAATAPYGIITHNAGTQILAHQAGFGQNIPVAIGTPTGIQPFADDASDLGIAGTRWRNLYVVKMPSLYADNQADSDNNIYFNAGLTAVHSVILNWLNKGTTEWQITNYSGTNALIFSDYQNSAATRLEFLPGSHTYFNVGSGAEHVFQYAGSNFIEVSGSSNSFFPSNNNTTSLGKAGNIWSDIEVGTVNGGAPQVSVATVSLTAQTASIGLTTMYTNSTGATHIYNVCGVAKTTSAGSAGTVTWTLSISSVQGNTTSASNLAIPNHWSANGCFTASVPNAGTIQYNTTVSGASGSPQYSLDLVASQIK
jgi:hypothetical protein